EERGNAILGRIVAAYEDGMRADDGDELVVANEAGIQLPDEDVGVVDAVEIDGRVVVTERICPALLVLEHELFGEDQVAHCVLVVTTEAVLRDLLQRREAPRHVGVDAAACLGGADGPGVVAGAPEGRTQAGVERALAGLSAAVRLTVGLAVLVVRRPVGPSRFDLARGATVEARVERRVATRELAWPS